MKIHRTIFAAAIISLWFMHQSAPCTAAEQLAANLSKPEIIKLGERMYRDGLLPSGKIMAPLIKGEVEKNSTAYSCASCHLRAGLGSEEGGVVIPPANGAKLFKPYRRPPSKDDNPDRDRSNVYVKAGIERPAYTRESLAIALRSGIDPAGRIFNDAMPRYPLTDGDMSILIRYLESLSSEPSPGAGSNEFRFATIITDDVNQEDRQALLLPLQTFIAEKNQQLQLYNDFIKFGYTPTADMKYSFRRASLDIWELKGPPATWQSQLDTYYHNRPVFAVLGGISNRDWQPIHNFCEAERLPCLFPVTDFPVLSETAWYTYYFNKGYFQEGEAVARYLNSLENLPPKAPILQIIQDSPAGNTLAAGFQSSWHELERPSVITFKLTSNQLLDQPTLNKLLTKHKPVILLLWADGEVLKNLPMLASQPTFPAMVFVSSTFLGKKTGTIAETVRDKVYITYPYRLTPYAGPKTGGRDARIPILSSAKDFGDRRIESRTVTILKQAILPGLSQLYDNLYRDHLMDILSSQMMDLVVRDYEQLSFGPGQRYVSKGCYIIQLGPGPDPALLQRSEWVIH